MSSSAGCKDGYVLVHDELNLHPYFADPSFFRCCSGNLKDQAIVQDNFIKFDTFLNFSFANKQRLLLPSISTPNARNRFFAFCNGCYGYVVLGKISQSHSRNWALVGK